jgi:hypothetical protein
MGGSRPNKQEYTKKSPSEEMTASVGLAEQKKFQKKYQPLLNKERDLAGRERVAPTLKGRAQADTMQALTGQSNLSLSQGLGQAANIALGAVNQQLLANTSAVNSSTKRQADVLAAGKGQQFDAGDALALSSRLGRSKGLATADANQQVRLAKNQAMVSGVASMTKSGLQNMGETSNFFRHNVYKIGEDGKSTLQGTAGPFGMNEKYAQAEKKVNPFYVGDNRA